MTTALLIGLAAYAALVLFAYLFIAGAFSKPSPRVPAKGSGVERRPGGGWRSR